MTANGRPRGLFVMDLDGTLLGWDGTIPARNLHAMRRADEAGVALAVVTGRRRSTTRAERARLGGLRHRWSVCNGAVVLAEDHERPEAVLELDWERVRHLAELPALRHAEMFCITLPPPPAPGADEEPEVFILTTPDREWRISHLPWDGDTHVAASASSALERRLLHVALIVRSRDEAERLEAPVREVFGATAAVHAVRHPRAAGALIEVVPAGGKGNAARHLIEQLGVDAEATGGIGDEMNDATLLDAVRHRFAVGGSVLAARRPDAVEVAPFEAGAVGDALGRFLATLGLAR